MDVAALLWTYRAIHTTTANPSPGMGIALHTNTIPGGMAP